jgi:Kef-type K+ transport system membrane component KefB
MDQPDLTHSLARLVLQLGVVLIAAKLGAELAERLGQPTVLGELLAGVAIGPFALGGLALPLTGEPLFGGHGGNGAAISAELYGFAQVAAVLLLFLIGLNTDLLRFLRYSHAAALVAVGGNLLSFLFGAGVAVALGLADHLGDPEALFLGGIIATTSVGITARVLADLGQLDTAEGVIILGGAVVDDVLGIIGLGLAVSAAAGQGITVQSAALSGGFAVGALVALTAGTLLLARQLFRLPLRLRTEGATVGLALGSALVAAYVIEAAGLAMILGSYAVGLALSQTPIGRAVERALAGVRQVFVPVFFVVMGTLVNVPQMTTALGLGLALCLAAVLGKALGSGLPAVAVGFRGARVVRIVAGMLPRGEVALIVAGVGLTSGAIGGELFGVAILLVLATTVLGSTLLAESFGATDALPRIKPAPPPASARRTLVLSAPTADLFAGALDTTLRRSGLTEVVRYHDFEGREIAEFSTPDAQRFLSVALHPVDQGMRQMQIEFGSGNWPDLVAAAIDEAVRQVAYEVLEPLVGEADDARVRARRYLLGMLQTEEELGV